MGTRERCRKIRREGCNSGERENTIYDEQMK